MCGDNCGSGVPGLADALAIMCPMCNGSFELEYTGVHCYWLYTNTTTSGTKKWVIDVGVMIIANTIKHCTNETGMILGFVNVSYTDTDPEAILSNWEIFNDFYHCLWNSIDCYADLPTFSYPMLDDQIAFCGNTATFSIASVEY